MTGLRQRDGAVGDAVGLMGIDRAQGALAVRIFACFAAGYFMSYGLRSINAVLAPALRLDLGLTNAQLGSLSSAYFLAFALMQVPVGIWLDRIGPRRVDAVLMGVAGVGCVVFATAHSVLQLWIGRALIGTGVAAGLMASLTAYRQWFAPQRQAQMAAWMLVVGTAGAVMVTVPVDQLLHLIGWRGVCWVAAAMFAGVAIAMWGLLPREQEAGAPPAGSLWQACAGFRVIFGCGNFWRLVLTAGGVQGGFVALQTLWVGPWLATVLETHGTALAQQLFIINLMVLVGFLALGSVAVRLAQTPRALNWLVILVTMAVIVAECLIAWGTGPHAWWLWLVLGICAVPYTVVQPRLALTFPEAYAGRALTAFNLVVFLAMFVTQWLFGVAIDAWTAAGLSTPAAFRATMIGFASVHGLLLLSFVLWPRRWR